MILPPDAVAPSGTNLTGGGFATSHPSMVIEVSRPSFGRWEVSAFNAGDFLHSFTPYALCPS
jgi:hypothetical protein